MQVTSPKFRLGRFSRFQLAPESSLTKRREFLPPARMILGFCGSSAIAVAVPPNGPAIFQSSTGKETAHPARPMAQNPIASGEHRVQHRIILRNICFKETILLLTDPSR